MEVKMHCLLFIHVDDIIVLWNNTIRCWYYVKCIFFNVSAIITVCHTVVVFLSF